MSQTRDESKGDFIVYDYAHDDKGYNIAKKAYEHSYNTLQLTIGGTSVNPTFYTDNEQVGMSSSGSLGQGIYGVIHLYHTLGDSETIVKQITLKDSKESKQQIKEKLKNEADLNLRFYGVGKFHYDEQHNVAYIKMKKLPPSLNNILDDIELPRQYFRGKYLLENLQLLLNILNAINNLHEAKIVHRDIHWGNICISKNFEVSLCDFERAAPLTPEGLELDNKYTKEFLEFLIKKDVQKLPYLAQAVELLISKGENRLKKNPSIPITVKDYIEDCEQLIADELLQKKKYTELEIKLNEKKVEFTTFIITQKNHPNSKVINSINNSLELYLDSMMTYIFRESIRINLMAAMELFLKIYDVIQKKVTDNLSPEEVNDYFSSLEKLKDLWVIGTSGRNIDNVSSLSKSFIISSQAKNSAKESQDKQDEAKSTTINLEITSTTQPSKLTSQKTENTFFQRFKAKWAETSPWIKIPLAFLVTAGLLAIAATGIGAIIEVAIGVGGVTGGFLFASVGSLIVAKGASLLVGAAVVVGGLGVAITGLFSAAMKFATKNQTVQGASNQKTSVDAPTSSEAKITIEAASENVGLTMREEITPATTIRVEHPMASNTTTITGFEEKKNITNDCAPLSTSRVLGSLNIDPMRPPATSVKAPSRTSSAENIESKLQASTNHQAIKPEKLAGARDELIKFVKQNDSKEVTTILVANPQLVNSNGEGQYQIYFDVFVVDPNEDFSMIKLLVEKMPKDKIKGLLEVFEREAINKEIYPDLITYIESLRPDSRNSSSIGGPTKQG